MNRKLLIGLGSLIAAVLLFVFVVNPLLLSEDLDETDTPAAAAPADDEQPASEQPASEEPEAEDEVDEHDPLDETFEVFTARDPFQQLVSPASGASAISTGTGNGDGNGGGNGDGNGGGNGDGNGGDPPPGTSVGGTTIELIEVFEDVDGTPTVQVTVNGSGYEVTEGDDFASRFRVLDVTGQCATFLFGDQRFTLCEGESIRK